MQYKTLLKVATLNESPAESATATIPLELFRNLLMVALKAKGEFDEAYYLAANPDIRAAIRKKEMVSGAEHYYKSGYFEGRMPKKFVVDEEYYVRANPDVAKAITQRKIKNAQLHFDTNGFKEGRAPYEGFSLF